jgi:hypothetical protein
MDSILEYAKSLNQISFIAFILVLGFLIYEIVQFRKEQSKKQKINVPQFNQNAPAQPPLAQPFAAVTLPEVPIPIKKAKGLSPTIVIIGAGGILLLLVIGGGFMVINNTKAETPAPVVTSVQEVQSGGIKLYTKDWQEIKKGSVNLKTGDSIYVALEMIPDQDIDKARIRVNSPVWRDDDVTASVSSELHVFYREYVVGEDVSNLKIEAQLHSKKDGWLTE